MESLTDDKKELIYKTETDSQTKKIDLWLLGESGGRGGIDYDWQVHTAIFKMKTQQASTV